LTWAAPCGRQRAGLDDHRLHHPVFGQHREDDVGLHRLGRRRGGARAPGGERLDGAGRAVPDGHRVAGLEQVRGDRRAHGAEADEAEIHAELLVAVAATNRPADRRRSREPGAFNRKRARRGAIVAAAASLRCAGLGTTAVAGGSTAKKSARKLAPPIIEATRRPGARISGARDLR
jgi:hypothetical protein